MHSSSASELGAGHAPQPTDQYSWICHPNLAPPSRPGREVNYGDEYQCSCPLQVHHDLLGLKKVIDPLHNLKSEPNQSPKVPKGTHKLVDFLKPTLLIRPHLSGTDFLKPCY
jgi:hypothetical protein